MGKEQSTRSREFSAFTFPFSLFRSHLSTFRLLFNILETAGINGIGWQTEDQFRGEYREMLDAILSVSPDTKIVLQSMLPVTSFYNDLPANQPDDPEDAITNDKIAKGNLWIAHIAREYGFGFLNIAPTMLDANGFLKSNYSSGNDGLHLSSEGYKPIVDFYRRHRIEGFE